MDENLQRKCSGIVCAPPLNTAAKRVVDVALSEGNRRFSKQINTWVAARQAMPTAFGRCAGTIKGRLLIDRQRSYGFRCCPKS